MAVFADAGHDAEHDPESSPPAWEDLSLDSGNFGNDVEYQCPVTTREKAKQIYYTMYGQSASAASIVATIAKENASKETFAASGKYAFHTLGTTFAITVVGALVGLLCRGGMQGWESVF